MYFKIGLLSIFSVVLFSFLFFQESTEANEYLNEEPVHTVVGGMSKEAMDKVENEARKQNKLEEELSNELLEENIEMNDILSEGDFYFNDEQLVILLKNNDKANNKNKVKKSQKK